MTSRSVSVLVGLARSVWELSPGRHVQVCVLARPSANLSHGGLGGVLGRGLCVQGLLDDLRGLYGLLLVFGCNKLSRRVVKLRLGNYGRLDYTAKLAGPQQTIRRLLTNIDQAATIMTK
jgi:hypothetical protein